MCCYKRTVKNMDESYRVHFITRHGQIVQNSNYYQVKTIFGSVQRAIFRISATVRGIAQLSRRYNEACEGVSELVGSW